MQTLDAQQETKNMDMSKLTPKQDNILVQFVHHASRHEAEQLTPGGIIIPKVAEAPSDNSAIEAVIIAAGPGRYLDKWVDHEQGTSDVGSKVFIPTGADLKPGAHVLLESSASACDRVWGEDRLEYRMVKEHNCIALVEDD